jgi:hypothetical protein
MAEHGGSRCVTLVGDGVVLADVTAPMQVAVVAGLYTAARLGLSARTTGTVEAVLDRPARSFKQYVADRCEVWSRSATAEESLAARP